nr:MAG TPA: hypothetical protein [Caudoviricetes sp.]
MLITAEIEKNRATKVEIVENVVLVCTSHNDLYDLEIYDNTTGIRNIITVCNDEKNFGTINCYAGELGVKFVEKQNGIEDRTAKFKVWHDSSAPAFRRYSIQPIDDDGTYFDYGYFAPDLETVLLWAQDNYPKCRWIFEIIEVNDD